MWINEEMKEKIIDGFDLDFYNQVEAIIDMLISRWKLSHLQLIDSFSANMVFKAKSEMFGPVVVKFGHISHEFKSEVEALKFFDGYGFCSVYDVDEEHMVLLEEAIEPGEILKDEPCFEDRLRVFCDLYQLIHWRKSEEGDEVKDKESNSQIFRGYKSYQDWIYRITEVMKGLADWKEVADHMIRAKEAFDELSMTYDEMTLLHGDFHYYNILKSEIGYKVIDPKGVIGDPVFDVARYMLNEFWNSRIEDRSRDMKKMFRLFSRAFDIPESDLGKLLYMEGVLSACWEVESGAPVNEKTRILKTLKDLETYLP